MIPVFLTCIVREQGKRRWYSIHVQPCLFGGVSVVCRWGRIGNVGGAEKVIACDSEAEADATCRKIIFQKQRRGYVQSNALTVAPLR